MHDAAGIHVLALGPKGRDGALFVDPEIERTGRIVFEGTPADLKANQTVRKEWLEV